MSKTHIIIVNWNGAADTIECLESLLRVPGDFTVTVCDNGSTDASITRIAAWAHGAEPGAEWSSVAHLLGPTRLRSPTFRIVEPGSSLAAAEDPPFLTILPCGSNLGFAGGNNAGIRLALKDQSCRFIWLLNNDTVVSSNALCGLVERMADPRIAVCGSTLAFYDDPQRIQALGAIHHLYRARGEPIGLGLALDQLPAREDVEKHLDYVVGASLFVRREVFQRTGGLCEDYFLYFEELDLARRLAPDERLGWAPGSVVFHREGGSIGTSSRARPSPTSLYYLRVNVLRFYRQHHPLLLPIAFARLGSEMFQDILRHDPGALKTASMAILDFISGRRRVGPIPTKVSERDALNG